MTTCCPMHPYQVLKHQEGSEVHIILLDRPQHSSQVPVSPCLELVSPLLVPTPPPLPWKLCTCGLSLGQEFWFSSFRQAAGLLCWLSMRLSPLQGDTSLDNNKWVNTYKGPSTICGIQESQWLTNHMTIVMEYNYVGNLLLIDFIIQCKYRLWWNIWQGSRI